MLTTKPINFKKEKMHIALFFLTLFAAFVALTVLETLQEHKNA